MLRLARFGRGKPWRSEPLGSSRPPQSKPSIPLRHTSREVRVARLPNSQFFAPLGKSPLPAIAFWKQQSRYYTVAAPNPQAKAAEEAQPEDSDRPARTPSQQELQEKRRPEIQKLMDRAAMKKSDLGAKFDLIVAIFKGIPDPIRSWSRVNEDLGVAATYLQEISSSKPLQNALLTRLKQVFTEAQRMDLHGKLVRAEMNAVKEPTEVHVQAHLAHVLLLSGSVDKAWAVTRRAAAIAGSNVHFMLGVEAEHKEADATAEAEAHHKKALQLWPENSAALTNLGVMAYYRSKNKELAMKYLDDAIQCDSGKQNFIAHFHKAYILETEFDNFDQAKLHYGKAIEIYPAHAQSHCHLGSLLLEEGYPDLALEHFRKAVEIAPQKLLMYYTIANCYSVKGMVEIAVNYMEQALKVKPDWPHTHYLLGNIYFNHKMADECVLHYKRVVEIVQQNKELDYDPTPAINNMVIALRKRGYLYLTNATSRRDYEKAAKYLSESLVWANKENEKLTSISYMNLAYCCMKSSKPTEAIQALQAGLTLGGPGFVEEFTAIKGPEASKEIYDQLQAHLDGIESTEENSPLQARAHFNAAFCLFHLGDAQAALEHLKEAIRIAPNPESDYIEPDLPDRHQRLVESLREKVKVFGGGESTKKKKKKARSEPEEESEEAEAEAEGPVPDQFAVDRELTQTKFNDPIDVIDPSLYIKPPGGVHSGAKKATKATMKLKAKKIAKSPSKLAKKSLALRLGTGSALEAKLAKTPKKTKKAVSVEKPATVASTPSASPASPKPKPTKLSKTEPTIDSMIKDLEDYVLGKSGNVELRLLGSEEEKAEFAKLAAGFQTEPQENARGRTKPKRGR